VSVVVLISGRGSNMRSLVEAGLPVSAVISNRADAAGVEFARSRGLPVAVVAHTAYPTRERFDEALAAENIHPSLLPAFAGLHTHARALEAGVRVHGCTVHFVTADLDHGPIVVQAAVPVIPGDDEDRLAARVLAQEHRIYPQAVRWFLEGKLAIEHGAVRVRDPGARQWLFADQPA
jgi:phosphoribosylglycinamide formyltransferase-1